MPSAKHLKAGVGLVLLIIMSMRSNAITYTVTTATDYAVSGGVVTATGAIIGGAGAGQVSIRSAIIASNANVGADIILFNGALNGVPITLSIVNAGGLNEDACQTGDLDVTDNLSITGNGSANTIIQAGTTNANGIDKVFAINPFCDHAVAFTISGTTIRYGRNSQAFGAPDFSYTGGGIDWCGNGASTMTMTNCVVDNNNNLNGYGGGLNIDEAVPASGVVNITGTTFSNNNSYYWGGGLNIFGDNVQVTINSSTISGNTTTGIPPAGTQGGGVNIRITHQTANPIPFVTFDNTSIIGNTGKGYGGGVCIAGSGKQNVTFQNGSSITNNTVLLNGVICQGGGVEIDADPAFTNTFNNTTINSNHADAGANARGGGIFLNTGVMSMTGGSINSNTSREGGGFALEDGTATLSKVTITGNTATVSGGGLFTTTTSTGSLTMNFGRIVNNTAPAGSSLTRNTGTVSADNNWWGINTTPVPGLISGAVTVNNWLQLKSTASASPICSGSNSTVTASFLTNSVGTAVSTANLVTVIGQPVSFSAILGTLSGAQPTIQATGTATVTYTAGGTSGAGSVNAVVDNVPAGEITPATASITVNSPSVAPTGASGATTICNGGSTTLTVTGGSKGTAAVTQWFTGSCGGTLVFTGDALNTGALGATTTYFVRFNGTCNTTTCATITVTVNDITGGTVVADQTICSGGDPALFTESVASTGSGVLTYQWQSNTTSCAAAFSNIGGATSATYDAPAGLLVTTFYRRVTTSTLNTVPCATNSNCITVTINNVTGGTVAGNQGICSGGDPAAFTQSVASTGSGALTYQWQSSTTSCVAGFSNIGGATGTTYDPPAGLLVTTFYRRVATSTFNAVPCTANSNCITVTINVNTINLTSAAGTNAQVKPVNTAITTITYATTIATGATFSGLPPGVNGNWAANVATVSGTPTALGFYSYTVTLTGGCGGPPVTANGTINVTPPLPVSLVSFTGKLNSDKTVTLQWKVEQQQDILQYIVEESSDASIFSPLGAVAAGTGISQTYSYIDGQVATGYNYYRLKIIELSGKITYSNIVMVNLKPGITVMLYPNPVTGQLTIQQFGTIQDKTAILTDGQGKILQKINLTSPQQQVNMEMYPSGVYIVKMEDGTVFKVVKQ